jgi:tetratricopeptide (TPR) repeat protein
LDSSIVSAHKLKNGGDFAGALRILESAIQNQGNTSAPDILAVALNEAGSLHLNMGNVQEATRLLRSSIRLFEGWCGSGCLDTTYPLTNLARAWTAQRNFSKAQKTLEQVLEIRLAKLPQDDPAIGTTLSNLANVYLNQGRLAEASSNALRVVQQLERDTSKRPLALASAYNVLAAMEFRRGEFREAARNVQKGTDTIARNLGPEHPDIAPYLVNLAVVSLRLKEWSAAEDAVTRALAVTEHRLGQDNPWHAQALMVCSRLCGETGRTAEGKEALRRARTILAARSPAENSLVSIDDLMQGR